MKFSVYAIMYTPFRFKRKYIKRTKNWVPVPLKARKEYGYMPELMADIIDRCLADNRPMARAVPMHPDDPRTIAPHLAPEVPPPTEFLVAQHRARGIQLPL